MVGVGEIVGKFVLWVRVGWGQSEFHARAVFARRRAVRAAVQEQSVQTDLCGVPGNGRPFRGLLLDLPQHARRRACRLQHRRPEGALSDAQVAHFPATQRGGGAERFWSERVSPPLSVSIALLCSFLLGLGDSCFNTQLYSILGRVYAEESMPSFAIFKFIQVRRDYEGPAHFSKDRAAACHQRAVKTLPSPS